ncbi:glucose-6-phosphate isomerase [Notoacmeibacter sp. MSK16QG-6]|nr:glucose-6-phosphate isomerase [Notoacmeibacter sp. MSK16QG-6]MCP1198678.1 glucose-6-phosphate isomerase [Notoacmeibacter sp. MSK16QG-6]
MAALEDYHQARPEMDMRQAFEIDDNRFETFSLSLDDLLFDYSKCAVDEATIEKLIRLADAMGVCDMRDAMFAGEPINMTEKRAVLHTALRAPADADFSVGGESVMADVHDVLSRMSAFAERVRSGEHKGETGEAITDIVNIGIGGSDLGPAMVTGALAPYHDGPRCHFVSNVDGADMADTLSRLSPATTLFIVASKTFTTIETMTNAKTARNWLTDALGEGATGKHFVAVSTALDKVAEFGIAEENVFGFWDWVGGRYSVWSAIGLPVMLAVGPENFRAFLDGAHAMDRHFRQAEPRQNMPMLLGLIGWWHRVVCGYTSRAVIPYEQRLARLPAYLQQLDMESNGKAVKRNGRPALTETGPVVWGEPGTNGQHAFFQLLHQGTDVIPVEFILSARGHEPDLTAHHELLLANGLAQSEALMRGRTFDEALEQASAAGMTEEQAAVIAPHRVFPGDRPCITLLQDLLTPFALGRLIALYEHRVFVEGALFGINSFDQWGVELGKELATALLPVLRTGEGIDERDGSTANLVKKIRAARDAQ